ncbi:MAG: protoheme IX farnesyltransferase [Candidatus Lokiarchaeota archaeon]|nr:protoheme IX farnesyltransferase [Candidatus Lokiarchaeota archaeon]
MSIYGELIKAKQTILLLYTAIFSYLISLVELSKPFDWFSFLFLLLSLFLAVSGTTVLNMNFDRDMNAIMERTKDRPLPSGKVSSLTVLINGIILTFLGILISYLFFGWLTALVILFGFFFDVVIYSIWLKRRTKFSIIFGGIAGGLPAMAGRVAVLGHLDEVGMYFLLFILAWIPVHILTLALLPKNFNGYKEAKVPMWPIVSSKSQTMRVITFGAIVSILTLYRIAHILGANAIIRIIIFICDLFLFILVIKNLMKPSNKLTFLIFKVASLFMILGFLLLYLGVVF